MSSFACMVTYLCFITYFETVLGREHLQNAVSIELLDNFYFRGITIKAQFCNSISPHSNFVEIISIENFLELLEFYSPSCFSSFLLKN